MDHVAIGGGPTTTTTTSPTNDHSPNPQSPETAIPVDSAQAESNDHSLLARVVSAPTLVMKRRNTRRAQTHPGGPRTKGYLPFHPTAHPKEKLPEGISIPPIQRMFTGLLEAPRPVGDAPSIRGQLWNIVTYSWLNLLLLFIPISWAAVSNFWSDLAYDLLAACSRSSLTPSILLTETHHPVHLVVPAPFHEATFSSAPPPPHSLLRRDGPFADLALLASHV